MLPGAEASLNLDACMSNHFLVATEKGRVCKLTSSLGMTASIPAGLTPMKDAGTDKLDLSQPSTEGIARAACDHLV